MSVWDSDAWQWWLQYGFDGIAGGVVGGIVTGGAVWATIRHERGLRADDQTGAKEAELLLGLRRVHSALGEIDFSDVVMWGLNPRTITPVRTELLFTEIAARGAHEWSMAQQLTDLRAQLDDVPDADAVDTTKAKEFQDDAEKAVLSMVAEIMTRPPRQQRELGRFQRWIILGRRRR
jgi:hypothetical protein